MPHDAAEKSLKGGEIAHDAAGKSSGGGEMPHNAAKKSPKGGEMAHDPAEKCLKGGEIRRRSFRLLRREERCIRIVANFWTLMVLKTEFFQVLSPTFIANSNNHNFCAFIKSATWDPTFP